MAAAPSGVASCATPGVKKLKNAGPTLAAPRAREAGSAEAPGRLAAARGHGAAGVVHRRGSAGSADGLQEEHAALGFRPGWPPTITPSPGANVSFAQPYCFIAVEGNASTTHTRSLPFSRTDR